MYLESNNPLPLVQDELHTSLIAYNEQTITRPGEDPDDPSSTVYTYQAVRVPRPYTYDSLVAAIITDSYDSDRMQAIINNHLLADGNPDHETEYQAMQSFRAQAKQLARQVLSL